VNRHWCSIRLQDQYARASHCIWIVLDNDSLENTGNDVIYQYTVFREFVIAVVRYANGSTRHERLDLSEGLAQRARISFAYSAASLAPRRRGLPAFFSTGSRNLPV
jgi:hypothetical protein